MAEDIILDMGEYGVLAVEPSFEPEGLMPASAAGEAMRVLFSKALGPPLTGLSKAMLATLPEDDEDLAYHLDQFTMAFEIGLGSELGTDGGVAGVVAKVMGSGTFKCNYTWKRK